LQFKLVLLGAILLTVGLLAYSLVPNTHRTPVVTLQPVEGSQILQVPASTTLENARNVTILQGQDNLLLANITITNPSGTLSSLHFQLLASNSTNPCDSTGSKLLADRDVSNNSLTIPMTRSGAYCFVFDNVSSSTAKVVKATTIVQSSFIQVQVSNDGTANMAGVAMAAFGFLVALAGFARKTVIPWE
jgi:hypothetical protein